MTINTGLKGQTNYEIIKSIFGQLSDGIWENSSSMKKYWLKNSCSMLKDGTIVLNINDWCFKELTEEYIKAWFAKKLKQIVKTAQEYEGDYYRWDRLNINTFSGYIGYRETISVRDVYKAYDTLLERNIEKLYA